MHRFGILNINKPADWTSRDVVNRVQRIARPAKVGHAGTLDPLATGVLLCCVGPATRLMTYIHQLPKSYQGTFLLGKTSPTEDTEGEITSVPVPNNLQAKDLEAVLPNFLGDIEQIPPAYSAIRIDGERAYKAARRGDDVTMPSRRVLIHKLELVQFDSESFTLNVECGTGTYIRSLGRDIARAVKTDAVMSELTRTSIGPFSLRDSLSVDDITRETIDQQLLSPKRALDHLPNHIVSQQEAERFSNGLGLAVPDPILANATAESPIVVVNDGRVVGLGIERRGQLGPHMVFK